MAGKVTWAGVPGRHAYSVDGTVGPWGCKNELLDVMLVQFMLKEFFGSKGSRDPIGKTISVNGHYDATTHYWTLMCRLNNAGDYAAESEIHKFKPLVSLTPSFLDTDNSVDLMEMLNRVYSKNHLQDYKDLSVVPGVPAALQKRLKVYGYTL